jgi:hypothetical protein
VKIGKQKGGQDLSERVDELVCHVLCAGTKLKHGKNLGAGINGQPEPEHLRMAAEPGAQFVQLQVRELEMAEGAFVQDLCVLSSSGQKGWRWWFVGSSATRSAAERSSPSASAESTTAIC